MSTPLQSLLDAYNATEGLKRRVEEEGKVMKMFVMIEAARDGGFIVKGDVSLSAVFAGSLEACLSYARSRLLARHNPPPPETVKPVKSADPLDDMSVDDLEISTRASNVFQNEGIKTVGELRGMTDGQLLRLPQFGRVSLKEVREAIAGLNAR